MVWYNTQEESDSTFDELPQGAYRFIVTAATVKATKAGGQMAEATLEVVEGEHKGGKCWARFNVENANAVAQRIGRAEMKRFLSACGVTEALASPNDFGRAVAHKVLWGEVTHEKKDNKTFVRVGGFNADVPGAPPPSHQPARSAATDAIPF